ncbi:MAG: hypothetical protein AAB345_04690 [Patescibacteria group bacterium]
MTQATINKRINKTAEEMQNLIRQSKRKLLELEVALSLSEIKQGKVKAFKSTDALLRAVA